MTPWISSNGPRSWSKWSTSVYSIALSAAALSLSSFSALRTSMKLMVRLLPPGFDISAKSSFSSMFPVVPHGDLISGISFLCGSSTTLLQSKETFSLTGFSSGAGAASNVFSAVSGSEKSIPAKVLNSGSGLATLAPHSLQNFAPSTSWLPQLLQNITTSVWSIAPERAGLTFFARKKRACS